MILLDTSVWVDYLRGNPGRSRDEARRYLTDQPEQVAMCEPIAFELLAGPTHEPTVAKIEQLVNGLPTLAVDPVTDFRTAATIFRSGRKAGHTIRSLNDCLIAAVALRHRATLVHKDADYEVIARFTALDAVSLR